MSQKNLRKLTNSLFEGDLSKVQEILAGEPGLAKADGSSALAAAISLGNLPMVEELIARGADAGASEDGEPFIWMAAGNEPVEATVGIVQALLKAGANPNACEEEIGVPALHRAVAAAARNSPAALQEKETAMTHFFEGAMKGLEEGLEAGLAAIEAPIVDKEPPAEEGSIGPRGAVVDLLVAAGARIDAVNRGGATGLDLATSEKDEALARHLIAQGATDRRQDGQLSLAVNAKDLARVEELLAAGADPNRDTPRYGRPLNAAAQEGRLALAKVLLAAGAGLDVAEDAGQGHTPLTVAAYGGHLEVIRLLLEAGASTAVAGCGRLPVAWARFGQIEGNRKDRPWEELINLLEKRTERERPRPVSPISPTDLLRALEPVLGEALELLAADGWHSGTLNGQSYFESPPLAEGVDASRLIAKARSMEWSAVLVHRPIEEGPVGKPGEGIDGSHGTQLIADLVEQWGSTAEDDDELAAIARNPLPGKYPDGSKELPRGRRLVLSDGPAELVACNWQFCQPNVGLTEKQLGAMFQSWRQRFGAVLVAFDRATALFDVEPPLVDEASIRRAAAEIGVVDPDIIEDPDSLLAMAASARWSLWWD
ncbi:MAG: ankyrin repeat domain-containing protein [Deltaproteobacteria bacterium]|nr:ankyrin repeat domain-containing protein [Deltaproteobacteria bacterium]